MQRNINPSREVPAHEPRDPIEILYSIVGNSRARRYPETSYERAFQLFLRVTHGFIQILL